MKNKIKAFFIILWQGIIKPLFSIILFILSLVLIFLFFLMLVFGIEWLFNFWFPGKGNDIVAATTLIIMGLSIIIIGGYYFISYIRNDLIPAYYGALNWLKTKDKEKSNNEE